MKNSSGNLSSKVLEADESPRDFPPSLSRRHLPKEVTMALYSCCQLSHSPNKVLNLVVPNKCWYFSSDWWNYQCENCLPLAFYKIRGACWQGGWEKSICFISFSLVTCINMETFHIHWTVPFIGRRLYIPAAAPRA